MYLSIKIFDSVVRDCRTWEAVDFSMLKDKAETVYFFFFRIFIQIIYFFFFIPINLLIQFYGVKCLPQNDLNGGGAIIAYTYMFT